MIYFMEPLIHVEELLLFLLKDAVTICTLGTGTAFGESILDNTPRHATIVTREFSELLRIEQREFKSLWEVRAYLTTSPVLLRDVEFSVLKWTNSGLMRTSTHTQG